MEASSYHASHVARDGQDAVLVAANRQQRYRTTFRRDGIEIASKPVPGQEWRLAVSLTGFGYEGDLRPLPVAEPVAEKGRVEYRRGPVTEWYENRPSGLEQGFTIAEPPMRRDQRLELVMTVDGGLFVRVQDGREASFNDGAGQARVRYAGLRAWDADGRPLASSLEADGGQLRVLVETGAARFPVTVDPTFGGGGGQARNPRRGWGRGRRPGGARRGPGRGRGAGQQGRGRGACVVVRTGTREGAGG